MKTIILSFCILFALNHAEAAKKPVQRVSRVELQGYVGQRYQQSIDRQVKAQPLDTILNVFKYQNEMEEYWGTEFWGKWVQGAIGMYRYTGDQELYATIASTIKRVLAAQRPDGYIGNYDNEHQLRGWDVWGRKYTTLGLLKWYWETGDKAALKAACRLIDYTINQVGPNGKMPIYKAGLYKGMPPMSILEPVVFLYQTTKDERYLDFAKYIVEIGETAGGPQLIAKADVPVALRFPVTPDRWWHADNGQKAYEMMSCYVGMLELYRYTKDERLLQAAQKAYSHILREEINAAGSGASYECWYDGKRLQHRVAKHTMETCVTFTWMQFCERLLEFTHDSKLVDQIEKTMYNALFASMRGDGGCVSQYTPLEGYRHEGEKQCHMDINCCVANAPRAFAMIPRVQYRLPEDNQIDVNLYIPSRAEIQLGKNKVNIEQITDYPKTNEVTLVVNPEKPAAFTLSLRIPEWSKKNEVWVNNQRVNGVQEGGYCVINNQNWKAGDRVTLKMDVQTRIQRLHTFIALQHGPVLLARDSRFGDGFVDESLLISSKDNVVDAEPVEAPEGMWMAFRVKAMRGAYSEEFDEPTYFCDFSSAGNTWNPKQRYRVWLPRILNSRYDPIEGR